MSKLKAQFYECEEEYIKTFEKSYKLLFKEKESLEDISRRVYKGMTKNHVRLEKYQKETRILELMLLNALERITILEKKLEDLYYPMNERN